MAFPSSSTAAATSVLLAAAIGFVVGTAVPLLLGSTGPARHTGAGVPPQGETAATRTSSTPITSLLKDGHA